MSCYIYPAYLYKDNATIEDVSNLLKELFDIKQKFLGYMVEAFKKDCILKHELDDLYPDVKTAFNKIWECHNHELIENIKKDTASCMRGCIFDFQCNVTVYFADNKIVLQGFCSSNTKDFFKKNFKYKDYSYYDIYAAGGRVSKKKAADFAERQEFYFDKVFEKSGIPADAGFTYDFYSDDLLYDLEDELLDEKFGKDWDLELRKAKYNK